MEGTELIGRSGELARAQHALDRAARGEAQVLLVRGPAGIGRTAFIDAATGQASSRFHVVRISGHPTEADLPFAGLHHLTHALQQAASNSSTAGPGDLTDTTQLGIAVHLLGTIASLAEHGPVLIVIDDAQWIDPASRQALVFAARRLDAESVCLLLDVRTTGGPREEQTYEGLGEVIELTPLDTRDSMRLLRLVAPGTSARVAARLAEQAGGVPLMLTESLRDLSAGQLSGAEPLPRELPVEESLERLFGDRFARFTARERIALLTLCFEPLAREELHGILGRVGCDLEDLDAAERAGLLVLNEHVMRFRHPSIAAVLRGVARTAELTAVHRALAEHFTAEPLRRILHLNRLDGVPVGELRAAAIAAAEAADERLGQAEAGEYWEQAARLSVSDARAHGQYLRQALEAYVRAGASPAADRLLRELTESTKDQAERAALFAGRAFVSMWSRAIPPEDTDELLEFGLDLAASDEDPAARDAGRGLVTALAITSVGAARYRGAHEICRCLEEIDADTVSLDHSLIADVSAIMVGAPRAGETLRRDWVREYPWERVGTGMTPIPFVAVSLAWLGEFSRLDEVMRRYAAATEEGAPTAEARYLRGMISGLVARARGHWDSAAREFEALERFVIETDSSGPLPFVALHHAHLLASRGDAARSGELRALARNRAPVWTHMMEHLDLFVDGHTRLIARDYSAAAESFEEMRRLESEVGLVPSGYLTGLPDAFEAAWHLGDHYRLRVELDRYESAAEAVCHPEMRALASRCRALAATPNMEEADRLFAECLVQFDEAPAGSFESARTHLLWGQVLRRARRKSDAIEQLERAEHVFVSLGAAALLETCRAELAACGRRRASVPAVPGSPVALLTPREYEVAREVASGSSNAEAALRLFISERTVEFHLSQVFRKLQITGREGLRPALEAPGS